MTQPYSFPLSPSLNPSWKGARHTTQDGMGVTIEGTYAYGDTYDVVDLSERLKVAQCSRAILDVHLPFHGDDLICWIIAIGSFILKYSSSPDIASFVQCWLGILGSIAFNAKLSMTDLGHRRFQSPLPLLSLSHFSLPASGPPPPQLATAPTCGAPDHLPGGVGTLHIPNHSEAPSL